MSARIDEIRHACQRAGSLAPLFRLALPDEPDAEIQRGADALPLAGRKRSTRTHECNMQRARLVRCYRALKTKSDVDEAALSKALTTHGLLPGGHRITETRARELVVRPPLAVRKILQQRI